MTATLSPPAPSKDEEDGDEYLDFMEVVRKYEISRQSLHNLCAKGRVPYHLKYNGRRRFKKSEIDAYLRLERVAPTNPLPGRGAPEGVTAGTPTS